MPFPATAAPHAPAPLADAASPLPQGSENRVQNLALLLLRLSIGIALLPVLLLAVLAPFARRRPRAAGLWYLSPSEEDSLDTASPRALRQALAIIGWSLAGFHNRGMRPRARTRGRTASSHRPTHAPRAPPHPA